MKNTFFAFFAFFAFFTDCAAKPPPFVVGEKIVFAVKFLGIQAGIGTFEVKDIVEVRGRKAYHIVATAEAVGILSMVYPFKDRMESFMDVERLHSLRVIKSIKEGPYSKEETLEFDQEKHLVTYMNKEGKVERTETIHPDAQDLISAFFYFRTQEIEVGKYPMVKVHADGKNMDFSVQITGKETIKTLLGKQECFVVKPFVQFEEVFKYRGDVTLYVSNDERLIPVYIKADAIAGLVYCTLIEVVFPKDGIKKKVK